MNYFVGTVSPDSWRNSNSTKEGTHFISNENSNDYNYDYFYEKYREYLNNEFVLGYLIHLIVDKYWHTNNFIGTTINQDEYDELNKACSNVINQYEIKKLELPDDLDTPIEELEISGLIKTIDYLNSVNYLSDMNSNFNIDEVMIRIDETASFVINELLRLKNKVQTKALT